MALLLYNDSTEVIRNIQYEHTLIYTLEYNRRNTLRYGVALDGVREREREDEKASLSRRLIFTATIF